MKQRERSATHDTDLMDTVMECVARVLVVPKEWVQPSSMLMDLGARSIDFSDIVLAVETACGVKLLEHWSVPGPQTVAMYVAAVKDAMSNADKTTW